MHDFAAPLNFVDTCSYNVSSTLFCFVHHGDCIIGLISFAANLPQLKRTCPGDSDTPQMNWRSPLSNRPHYALKPFAPLGDTLILIENMFIYAYRIRPYISPKSVSAKLYSRGANSHQASCEPQRFRQARIALVADRGDMCGKTLPMKRRKVGR